MQQRFWRKLCRRWQGTNKRRSTVSLLMVLH